jgi:hypothetical protein
VSDVKDPKGTWRIKTPSRIVSPTEGISHGVSDIHKPPSPLVGKLALLIHPNTDPISSLNKVIIIAKY